MSSQTLDKLFGSRLRVKLLKFMFRNYPNSFLASELARKTQERPEEVKKELRFLLKLGLMHKNK